MLLRRFTRADLDDLADLHGDPRVMRYIDDGRPLPRHVVAEETLPSLLREYRELPAGLGCWAAVDRATEAFVGWFSLRPASSVGLEGGIEVGYRLRPAMWGRGYGTEGTQAVVDRGFTEAGMDRVVATTMVVNTASRRVLEKVGLKVVRVFFEDWPCPIAGAEHGDVEYELTRKNWQEQRNST